MAYELELKLCLNSSRVRSRREADEGESENEDGGQAGRERRLAGALADTLSSCSANKNGRRNSFRSEDEAEISPSVDLPFQTP